MSYAINNLPSCITIGRETETAVTEIRIDCAEWLDRWSNMDVSVIVRTGRGAIYIPANLTMEGKTLVWCVDDVDTSILNKSTMEITGIAPDRHKLSEKVDILVDERLAGTTGETPDPMKPWVDRVIEAANTVGDARNDAVSAKDEAFDSANVAYKAAFDARESEKNAHASEQEAAQSANIAKDAEENTRATLVTVNGLAEYAKSSAEMAKESEEKSLQNANNAGTYATSAKESEIIARESGETAKTSAQSAQTSAGSAAESANQAKRSEEAAKGYADNTGEYARIATEKAQKATEQANSAGVSATSAEESANRASASEQNAATSAQEAKSSADSTKGYSESANEAAVNASDSARKAQVSAENAAASANNAEASKASAQVSAENARVSSQNAEDALQELRDKIASGEFKGEPGEPGKDAVVDATLTQSGQAADAKVTGDAIGQLKGDVAKLTNATAIVKKAINKWKPTGTGAYYTQYGSYKENEKFAYQELFVETGDVIKAYYWDGTQYIVKDKLISYITPYLGTSVKGEKGTTNAVKYTVPDGIDKVILSINIGNNPNNICVLINNTEVPTEIQEWSESDTFVPKVDDTLTKSGYFADSKKVGDTFAEFNDKFSNDGYRIGMITAENEVQDKRNAEHEYYIHEADSLRHLVSTLQNQIDTINPPTVLDSGACGENLTWELLSNGLLHISGTGRSYDFIKGGQIGKTIEQIRQYVIDHPDHPEYGERDGAVYHEYTANDGTYIGFVAPWYRYRPESGIGIYVSQAEYDKWNPNHWTYNRIKIDDGITYIGDWMFYRVCGATELVIPEGVTALGQWAIRYSTSLEIVKLPHTLRSIDLRGISRHEKALKVIKFEEGLESLGDYAFTSDKHLHTLILPSTLTTAGVSMCESDDNLVYVDCGGLTKIPRNAFANCTSLEKVKIGESCTEIRNEAFYKCALKELKIPSGVSIITDDAFAQCKPEVVLIDSPTIASLPLGRLGALFSNAKHIYVKNGLSAGGSILNTHKKVGTYCGYDYYVPKTNQLKQTIVNQEYNKHI